MLLLLKPLATFFTHTTLEWNFCLCPSNSPSNRLQFAGPQFNASLFWSILAVILCLALVMVGILIYYCCPGVCGCCCEEW